MEFWLMIAAIIIAAFQNLICWRFFLYVRSYKYEGEQPKEFVSVLVPCRGVDPGLKENLTSLLNQDYPSYEVVFAVRDVSDPAYPILEDLKAVSKKPIKVVVAPPGFAKIDKLNNLLAAYESTDERATIIATMDSDVSPPPNWLRNLVAPLADRKIGITSGYRFYLPPSFRFASYLHSIWSACLALFMPYRTWTSAYGGSMAFRKEFFDSYRVKELWRNAISDDITISNRALKMGYHILFIPDCIVPSFEHSTWKNFLEWSNRQSFIIKLYATKRWLSVCILFIFWYILIGWGIVSFISGLLEGHFNFYAFVAASALIGVVLLNGFLMAKAVGVKLPGLESRYRHVLQMYPIFALIGQLLSPFQIFPAGLMRKMRWRGSVYRVRSPYDVKVIS